MEPKTLYMAYRGHCISCDVRCRVCTNLLGILFKGVRPPPSLSSEHSPTQIFEYYLEDAIQLLE